MARDRRARKTIYDNDATVIIQGTEDTGLTKDNTRADALYVEPKLSGDFIEDTSTIELADVFDTLVSYTPLRWFVNKRGIGVGTCSICGKETKESIRKICGDCMDKYQTAIYRNAKEAIANGESYINL